MKVCVSDFACCTDKKKLVKGKFFYGRRQLEVLETLQVYLEKLAITWTLIFIVYSDLNLNHFFHCDPI